MQRTPVLLSQRWQNVGDWGRWLLMFKPFSVYTFRSTVGELFDGICNPVVLNIGICNAVVVVGLQILIIVAARIANPAERGYSVAGCCISTLDTPSIYISDKPHLLS